MAATRHLIQRSLRPVSMCLLNRSSIVAQRCIPKATHLPSDLQSVNQRYLQWANQIAAFHSSQRLLDENYVNIQDDDDFKEKVIGSDSPVVVDFHATWCGPCKALAPILEAVINNTQGQVKLAKVDIDELQDLAVGFRVNSVPTVMAFKGGQEVGKFIGLKSQADIEEFVEKLLS